MSIKRLALCRSQNLFCAAPFCRPGYCGAWEQEVPQTFAHATTNGACVPSLTLPVDHGRVPALFHPSVADYECELLVLVLPFMDGSTIDISFTSGDKKVGLYSP